jgi:predicted ribosomally synthesized peptide with SipW-like signal peptide
MSSHAAARRRPSLRFWTWGSIRTRAVLCLGLVAGLALSTSLAYWTDDVSVTGSTFTSGTLDIAVNGGDPYATTTLSLTAMVPGNSASEVLTVQNIGTAAAKYTLTGGLTGANATAYATDNALLLTIRSGGSTAGTGNARTCTGGTALVTDVPLTATTTTSLLARRPAPPLAGTPTPPTPGGTEALCFQITFSSSASTSLQGLTVTASFTATGTSDVS